MVFPDPYNGSGNLKIYFDITRPADKVTVRIYTAGFRRVIDIPIAGDYLRESTVTIERWKTAKLSAGAYYALIYGHGKQGENSISLPVVFLIVK
jgi:hypothetical protein